MADKDVDGVIAALVASAAMAGATVVCTSLDVPRAMPAAELAARWAASGARPAAGRRRADPIAALSGRARPSRARSSSPVRSILSGRSARHLVDDPALRDPDPVEDA